jgi:hypothetical protein
VKNCIISVEYDESPSWTTAFSFLADTDFALNRKQLFIRGGPSEPFTSTSRIRITMVHGWCEQMWYLPLTNFTRLHIHSIKAIRYDNATKGRAGRALPNCSAQDNTDKRHCSLSVHFTVIYQSLPRYSTKRFQISVSHASSSSDAVVQVFSTFLHLRALR